MPSIANARGYLLAALSILSIPSAYAAGFMGAVGSGVSNLLDSSFFTQEFARLALIVTGFLVGVRFSLSMSIHILKGFRSIKKYSESVLWARILTYAAWFTAILLISPILLIWTRVFLDARLIPSFVITNVMVIGSAFFLTSLSFFAEKDIKEVNVLEEINFKDINILEEMKCIITGKAGYVSAKIAAGTVFTVVLVSGNFGYHRAIALAISKPVCISTSDGNILASVVGQTSFGFVIAQVKEGEFHAFTFPVGIAVLYSSTFSFIGAQQDIKITANCAR